MTTIASVTNITLESATVTLSNTVDSAPVDTWLLEPSSSFVAPADVYHVQRTGAVCKVFFSPTLSPDSKYRIYVTTTTGGTATAANALFQVPSLSKPLGDEWSHGVLRVWTRAVAQAIQEFSGVPSTISTQDLHTHETALYVESTLGFPDKGYVYLGSERYRYTSKGPSSFRGLSMEKSTARLRTLRRRQVVYLDTASVWPPEGTDFLTIVGRDPTDPNGVL